MNVRSIGMPLKDWSQSVIIKDYQCDARFLGSYGITDASLWDVYVVRRLMGEVRLWLAHEHNQSWETLDRLKKGINDLVKHYGIARSFEDIACGILLNAPDTATQTEFDEYFRDFPEVYRGQQR